MEGLSHFFSCIPTIGTEARSALTWPGVIAVVAAVGAVSSAVATYLIYRVAALQALPHPDISWVLSSTGQRSLDFEINWTSGKAQWVVSSISIRGNWLRKRYLARGSLYHEDEHEGETIKSYEPTGSWQHCIEFSVPVRRGAVVIHHDAPDCEVKLKLALSTLPSPTVTRRIKLRRLGMKSDSDLRKGPSLLRQILRVFKHLDTPVD